MKAAASQTDGFYFYARTFTSLKGMIQSQLDALENTTVVEILDPALADAEEIIVDVNDSSLLY